MWSSEDSFGQVVLSFHCGIWAANSACPSRRQSSNIELIQNYTPQLRFYVLRFRPRQGFSFFFFSFLYKLSKEKQMLSHNLGQNSGFNHVRSKYGLLVLHDAQRGNVSVSFPTPQRGKEACLEYYTP